MRAFEGNKKRAYLPTIVILKPPIVNPFRKLGNCCKSGIFIEVEGEVEARLFMFMEREILQ